jgi:uncharacterized membrane protein
VDEACDVDEAATDLLWQQWVVRQEGVDRGTRRRSGMPAREAGHLVGTPAGRVLIAAVAVLAAVTIAGLVALWPPATSHRGPVQALGGPTLAAKVTAIRAVECPGPTPQRCRQAVVGVDGRSAHITLGPVIASPSLHVGQAIRVSRSELPAGVRPGAGFEPYTFAGVDRHRSVVLLALALAAVALLVLRWRGLLAIVGVGLSLLLLTSFVVPAILAGRPALLVALVGSLAVMFVTLVLTNGFGAQTLAGALGIAATLGLTSLLAAACIGIANLDGRSSELSIFLSQQDGSLSLVGVILAGMVIGALGVLADTAVTQASAVMALRRANPKLPATALYKGALSVGRDHLSATIHTLVLAYAGASLPLLLAMRSAGVGLTDALNAQDIAEPVLAAVVGCVGLIAAVPLTTALAALLVSRLPAELMPDEHGHHH